MDKIIELLLDHFGKLVIEHVEDKVRFAIFTPDGKKFGVQMPVNTFVGAAIHELNELLRIADEHIRSLHPTPQA